MTDGARIRKEPTFLMLNKACPKCGKQMIENAKYIECGEMRCDYIEEVKHG